MRRYYLRQRSKSGNWYVIFMNTVTKKQDFTRCTGTNIKKQADSIAQEWLANGIPEVFRQPKDARLVRNSIFCDYLRSIWDFNSSEYIKEKITEGKEPKRSHPIEMSKIIDRYFVPYFKQMLLCEITEEKMTDFFKYLRVEKGFSVSTVKLTRNAAIVPLRYAKRKKIIQNFNFDDVVKVNGESEGRGILARNQVETLFKLEWIDPRSRLINLIASQTAMRIGEIRALRVCDIHEDRINVEHSWSEADGIKCTKNRAKRVIPISPELYRELDEYMRQNNRYSKPDNLVFPGKNNDKPYTRTQINKHLYEMLKKIGVSGTERKKNNIVFHSWRHYGAKNLAEVANRTIGMAILGHKTARLFDHYANHIDNETFNSMRKAINDGLNTSSS